MLATSSEIDMNFAWQLMLCLAIAAHFAVKMLQGYASWKGIKQGEKPTELKQPIEISKRAQYAEKQETARQHREMLQKIDGIRAEMVDAKAKAESAARDRLDALKDMMNSLLKEQANAFIKRLDDEAREIFQRVNEQMDRLSRLEGIIQAKSKS